MTNYLLYPESVTKMNDIILTLNAPHPQNEEDRPLYMKGGEYTPSKAYTPMFVRHDAIRIPFEDMDIRAIARRVEQFVHHNRGSILNYVEPGQNKSIFLMENGMLYKNHLIVHQDMTNMMKIHVEVYLSNSSRDYLVEINRMSGSNGLYKYMYRGLESCILTGIVDQITIHEHDLNSRTLRDAAVRKMSDSVSSGMDEM